ncbi:hypothetical protein KSF_010120 [Reticulibacter mediterranei]|uniref:Uncharacterized protein n=1 Tax=Reticulibacter mediterranei TaxID=2778369 RepID=A0A8J3IGT9_9CHLR|nr:hypothetical protein KSF_010120 [Reticulibacter mediterranei]
MTELSLPGTHFVLIQTHLSFSFLKTLFHCPARPKSLWLNAVVHISSGEEDGLAMGKSKGI